MPEALETFCVHLGVEFHRDLAWFNQFLLDFNGTVVIHRTDITNISLYVDESLLGIGEMGTQCVCGYISSGHSFVPHSVLRINQYMGCPGDPYGIANQWNNIATTKP